MTERHDETRAYEAPDAAADPAARTTPAPAQDNQAVEHSTQVDNTTHSAPKKKVKRSLAGSTWTALIVGALLLIVLLAFIMQNVDQVTLHFFMWDFEFPLGVGMLLAAIIGALLMAIVGGLRMAQLRRQIRKS
ncbi:DUF1049 domain-containing protein [Corynebacterium sp. TAE3-ERU12]|uniref:LapA family protein n=1 Tax=Corynebacterium sp. TAE3-ERU12 TaxID=2849491 RepID=UPI001C4690EA|nr:lipopolysaccharide assembly protein LapA domain-containing protein [Corynebacterium sp. TAE3-ERU12]MBV7295230.1 DUF1049 domain-containing protein [Corynebacterium sp. TAE3-ERU12]